MRQNFDEKPQSSTRLRREWLNDSHASLKHLPAFALWSFQGLHRLRFLGPRLFVAAPVIETGQCSLSIIANELMHSALQDFFQALCLFHAYYSAESQTHSGRTRYPMSRSWDSQNRTDILRTRISHNNFYTMSQWKSRRKFASYGLFHIILHLLRCLLWDVTISNTFSMSWGITRIPSTSASIDVISCGLASW